MAHFSFPSAYSTSSSSSSSSSSSPSSSSDSSLSSIPSSMSPSPPATDLHGSIKSSSSSSAAIPPLSPLSPADHPSRESYPQPPQSLRLDASNSSSNSIHTSFHIPHPASAPPTQLAFLGVHDSDNTMGNDTNTNAATVNGPSHTPGLSQPYHSTHGPSFPSSSPALADDLQSDSRVQFSFPSPHSAPHTRLHFRFDDGSKYSRFHLQQPPNSDTSLLEQRRMSEPSITNGYSFVTPQLRAAYAHNQHLPPHMPYRSTAAYGSSAMPPPLPAVDTPRVDDQHSSPFAWKMESDAVSSPLGPSFPVGSASAGLDYPSSLGAGEDPYGPSPPGTGNSSIGSTAPPTFTAFPRLHHRQSLPSIQSGQQLGDESRQQYNFVPLPGSAVKKRPRRRYDEIERLYECSYPGCTKAYGTLNHLNAHVSMQRHGSKRSPAEFKELRKQWRKAKKEANAAQLENPAPIVRPPTTISHGLMGGIHHPSSGLSPGMHHTGVRPPPLGLGHNGMLLRRESEPDFQHHHSRLGGAPPLYVPQPPLHPRSHPGGGLRHEFGGPGNGGLLNPLPATGFPHQQASSGLHMPPSLPSAGDYDAHESTFSYGMPGMGYPEDGHVHDERPNTGHSYMSAASGDGGDGRPGTGHSAAGGHPLYLD